MIIVDYKLLKKQRTSLYSVFTKLKNGTQKTHILGLVNLLDAVQDERPFNGVSKARKK